MSTITWLHLSDLHLNDTRAADPHPLKDMLEDIRVQLDKKALKLNAVLFSGDIAFSGRSEQYKWAIDLFDEILKVVGLEGQRDKFFIVPGNHDVDREMVTRSEPVETFHKAMVEKLLDPKDEKCEKVKEFLALDDPDRPYFLQKFKGFKEFTESFYTDASMHFGYDKYCFARAIVNDDSSHTAVVLGLNSAWLSYGDQEQGRLLLGASQVDNALEEAKRKYPGVFLRVAMFHHPLYWLAEKDMYQVQQILHKDCHLMLRGHLHCPSISLQSTPDLHLCELAAGASFKAEHHAYNLVRVELEPDGKRADITAIVRLKPRYGSIWGPDRYTYKNADEDGKIKLSVPLD